MKKTLTLILLPLLFAFAPVQDNCLFRNPLCFYNTDVLSYLQILHKNQQYDQMSHFVYGPKVEKWSAKTLQDSLSEAPFGYTMKRNGIKELKKGSWSLTYQRTILGTAQTFKIKCDLVHDTCKVFLDEKAWRTIFKEY